MTPPGQWTVPGRIAETARRTPQATALRSGERTLSYQQLLRRMNQLAARLARLGVRPGDRVAVHMEPSLEAVVALLGVMHAGAAYLPSDPATPAQRLEGVLAEAAVTTALVDPGSLLAVAQRLELEPGLASLDGEADVDPSTPPSAESLAYVIFTSGTTGRPKGVCVPHRGLVNLCQAVVEGWGLTPSDRVHQFTPLSFDAAAEALFPPLFAGASVLVRDTTPPGPGEFNALIARHQLTCLTVPPIYMHHWVTELIRKGQPLPATVRLVCLGGDKIAKETRRLWDEHGGRHIPWINDYGPTEATITSTTHRCTLEGEQGPQSFFPIGKPLPNVRIYLLDPHGKPVPRGETGEIHIAGVGVAQGYLQRPEETAQRFLPDPHGTGTGDRMYRTGDLASELPDGSLVFLGRVDDQVKIRGHRVELQEVELTLKRHPGVREVAVLAVPDDTGDKKLVAYWVAEPGQGVVPEQLQDFLKERLPEYMRVWSWRPLDRLPLTENGKVDRRALLELPEPAPVAAAPAPSGGSLQEQVHSRLAELWTGLLGAAPKPEDSFFEVGGDSLLAMQLVPQIEDAFQVAVPLVLIFEAPVFSELSAHVFRLASESAAKPAP